MKIDGTAISQQRERYLTPSSYRAVTLSIRLISIAGGKVRSVSEWIQSGRDKYVLATKYTLSMDHKDPNASGCHRKNLHQSVNASLKRLNTDYIDILWMHAWDGLTPVEEVMRALDDLIRSGKVLYVGVSNAPAWWIAKANTIARFHGWSPFVGVQMEYSLLERGIEREFVGLSDESNLAITAWSPLAMGVLTGKYLKDPTSDSRFKKDPTWSKNYLSSQNEKIVKGVLTVAENLGVTAAQVAISWLRQKNGRVIPILGAKSVSQIQDTLNSLKVILPDETMEYLDALSRIEFGAPYEMLRRPETVNILFGETRPLIDPCLTDLPREHQYVMSPP